MKTARLPPPPEGPLPALLAARTTVRDYADAPLTLAQLAALLWAAQGITHGMRRTAPSAGALYPLEVFAVAGAVTGLPAGVYRYRPAEHAPEKLADGDLRSALADAALGQDWLADAAAILVLGAVPLRTTRKYGARGKRYVHIETGHAAQNVLLMAGALGLGAATVGAFDDAAVRAALKLPEGVEPLYLLPVGRAG